MASADVDHLMGGTADRTTLAGEGLQHQDGHSHIVVAMITACDAYNPAIAGEFAVIIHDGLRRMFVERENVFYYITMMNENYIHPPLVARSETGTVKGTYRFSEDLGSLSRFDECGGGRNTAFATDSDETMIVERSDEVPLIRWPRRFPLPRNFGVESHSRIVAGKTWPASDNARRTATLRIYRFDPEGDSSPRLDTFHVDLDRCGPMLLDAARCVDLDQGRDRFDPDLPPFLSRRHLWFLRHDDRWHQLDGVYARDVRSVGTGNAAASCPACA